MMRHFQKIVMAGVALVSFASPSLSAAQVGPGCKSPQHRQFDFWVGTWDVFPTGQDKLVARSEIENLYGGCVIRENWSPSSGTPGGSLSTYDPDDGHWHQVWMDAANARVMFDGDLIDGKMVLTGPWKGALKPGEVGIVRMTYSKLGEGAVRQLGQISTDKGTTWKPYFDFTYKPVIVPK